MMWRITPLLKPNLMLRYDRNVVEFCQTTRVDTEYVFFQTTGVQNSTHIYHRIYGLMDVKLYCFLRWDALGITAPIRPIWDSRCAWGTPQDSPWSGVSERCSVLKRPKDNKLFTIDPWMSMFGMSCDKSSGTCPWKALARNKKMAFRGDRV